MFPSKERRWRRDFCRAEEMDALLVSCRKAFGIQAAGSIRFLA